MLGMRRVIQQALATGGLALLLTAAVASAAAPAGPRLAVVKETWKPNRVTLLTVGPNAGRPIRRAGGQEGGGPVWGYSPLSWRWDGAEVAFSGLSGLFLARADRGGARSVNVGGAERPVFAPGGHTIAFTRGDEIWTIDLVTGEQRQLTPSRRGLSYIASSFSPDGATLLATRVDNRLHGDAEPVALHLGTGGVTRLLPEGLEPIYSPDGSKISLFRDFGNRKRPNRLANDLFVLNLANGSLRRLTRTPHKDELFASWDPSGERIAFARYRRNEFEWANSVVQINADGTCEDEIFALRRRVIFHGVAWQPGPGREAGPIDC
jgi:Tol biopolymer transport system component